MEELKEIGAQDVTLTAYGAVLATIPATVETAAPTIALLAHVDTAPQFPGKDVKPIVHRSYGGEDIVLPDDPEQVLSPKALPYLAQKVGDDIVTASGKTLLGADDKAGIAIIMAAARHLLRTPSIPHGEIRIGFTPDEEIGRGVHADLPARPRRRLRLHARRRAPGRDRLRDLLGRQRQGQHQGRLDPSRAGPRTSWSTRRTSPRRSSTRCRRSR